MSFVERVERGKNNVALIKKMFTEGTKVMLHEMRGEPQMQDGLKGEVKFVDDIGQIHVRWENGSRLALHLEEDSFEVIA